jgi:hypothetical protein
MNVPSLNFSLSLFHTFWQRITYMLRTASVKWVSTDGNWWKGRCVGIRVIVYMWYWGCILLYVHQIYRGSTFPATPKNGTNKYEIQCTSPRFSEVNNFIVFHGWSLISRMSSANFLSAVSIYFTSVSPPSSFCLTVLFLTVLPCQMLPKWYQLTLSSFLTGFGEMITLWL